MTDSLCVVCGRPTPDGYACMAEADRARAQLAEIADMTPAARDVAHRLSSSQSDVGGSGAAESTLPLDLGSTARLDAVERELGTWVRAICEERGQSVPPPAWPDYDPIPTVARWLSLHVEWMRHRLEVDEFLTDVEACARIVRGIARGPRESKYLGPCGAELELCGSGVADEDETWWYCDLRTDHSGEHDFGDRDFGHMRTCEGDVYGPAGGTKGTCRTCGAQVAQDERRAWLDEQVAGVAFRAAHIADAYGINVNTIRTWASRGHLRQVGIDRQLRPVYLVGDVLELAREAAARRAENEARRDRRETAEMGA